MYVAPKTLQTCLFPPSKVLSTNPSIKKVPKNYPSKNNLLKKYQPLKYDLSSPQKWYLSLVLQDDQGDWQTRVANEFGACEVNNWALPNLPALTTDIVISLDDKYLYASNWLRGDICQLDISDPFNVKLAG